MASTIGERVRITLFGQSHGEAIGVVMDGLPAGELVDLNRLQAFLDRRAPSKGIVGSGRREADRPRILSGLLDGSTCGAPLCAVIENADARPGDYAAVNVLPRPGHADYPALAKHHGAADLRGGGHLSGRLTAALCVAGGIALQFLHRRHVAVGAHILSIGSLSDTPFDPACISARTLARCADKPFPVQDDAAGRAMVQAIDQARERGDSLGGVVECCAVGLPVGLGSPVFQGAENRLSQMIFGIPGVRGISFGAGFEAAQMTGAEHNDSFILRDGEVQTATNRHGGVLGGMTTGMPLHLRVAFKPTPSIARPQRTVRLDAMREETLRIEGRHDPCFVPRAVPCVEAAVAITLLDLLLEGGMDYRPASAARGD